MLASERQSRILVEVQRRGSVRVAALADLLDVSDMTIRRDLDILSSQGVLDKVHGGAMATATSPSTNEPGFEAKWVHEQSEKAAIAAEAATMVEPGMALGLSAGTTTWALAHLLSNVPDLTVVTNSMQVAQVFQGGSGGTGAVILTGGVRTPSDALVGPVAVAALRQLHLDVLFLGVHGMTPRAGFSTPNLLEADVNRAFVEAANRLVVLADHTKWGEVGLSSIAPLERANALVCDEGLDGAARQVLGEAIGEVRIVRVGEASRT